MFTSKQSRGHRTPLLSKSGRVGVDGWFACMDVAFSLPKGRHNWSRLLPSGRQTEASVAAGGVSFPRETSAARVSPCGVAL